MQQAGIRSFFHHPQLMLENVQGAKEYLLDQGAKGLKKEKNELTDKEKKEFLEDPVWEMVKEVTKKNPGYALTFLRFAKEDKASKDDLETLLREIAKNKDRIKNLPRKIEDYPDMKKEKGETKPKNELLFDDLITLERRAKLKKFYQDLGPKMQGEFDQATAEEIEKLVKISNELEALPQRDGKKGWTQFFKTVYKYENDKGYYPEYNDRKHAFEDLIESAVEFIEFWKVSDDEFIEKLKSLRPQLEILYNKDKILVVSTRNAEAQKEVQGVLPWCIKHDSNFWNYVQGDRVQLVVLDGRKRFDDPFRSMGITVTPDGRITAGFDHNNSSISRGSNETVFELLRKKDLPEDLINKLKKRLPTESAIKVALMLFYKEESKNAPLQDILRDLLNLNKGFLRGEIDPEIWEKISADVTRIIFEKRKFSKEKILSEFVKNGIYSIASWNIWDVLLEDFATKEDIEKIKERTKAVLKNMEEVMELTKTNKLPGTTIAKNLSIMKEILENKDTIMQEFEKRIAKKDKEKEQA